MRWKQHPHSALHTSGGIWQPQPVIISEITVAALATLTAEATDTLLVDFNFFFFMETVAPVNQTVPQVFYW